MAKTFWPDEAPVGAGLELVCFQYAQFLVLLVGSCKLPAHACSPACRFDDEVHFGFGKLLVLREVLVDDLGLVRLDGEEPAARVDAYGKHSHSHANVGRVRRPYNAADDLGGLGARHQSDLPVVELPDL